jgi:hypothetical protein
LAVVVILTHRFDRFLEQPYIVRSYFPTWEAMGHRVIVHEGFERPPPGDAVLLHVDRTIAPSVYIEAMTPYPVRINGRATNIAKRFVSENLVDPSDGWKGPVIVKTDANAGALPERFHAEHAKRAGVQDVSGPRRYSLRRYPVFDSYDRVPQAWRSDPDLVVERFLPERDPRGYASRHWVFLGDQEYCTRIVGPHPVVKGDDMLERTSVAVPEEIRTHRRRLGFDFGKFDFVVHDGRAILLDANRTPTAPPALGELQMADAARMARGVAAFFT